MDEQGPQRHVHVDEADVEEGGGGVGAVAAQAAEQVALGDARLHHTLPRLALRQRAEGRVDAGVERGLVQVVGVAPVPLVVAACNTKEEADHSDSLLRKVVFSTFAKLKKLSFLRIKRNRLLNDSIFFLDIKVRN